MSRTNFVSMYKHLLSKPEQKLFQKIVADKLILSKMGLNKKTPFFRYGYGSDEHHAGPTVAAWLAAIIKGNDLLSRHHQKDSDLSGAMGKKTIAKKGKHKGLVQFEARNTRGGAFEVAAKWTDYAKKQFDAAAAERPRPAGKGKTGLKY
jgi:hypothetical protein